MFRSIAGCGDTLLPAVISLTVLSGIAELFRLCLYLWSAARKSLFIYLHISQRRAKLGSPLKKPRFPHQISSATRWFFFQSKAALQHQFSWKRDENRSYWVESDCQTSLTSLPRWDWQGSLEHPWNTQFWEENPDQGNAGDGFASAGAAISWYEIG